MFECIQLKLSRMNGAPEPCSVPRMENEYAKPHAIRSCLVFNTFPFMCMLFFQLNRNDGDENKCDSG